jgi:hypothetical protein
VSASLTAPGSGAAPGNGAGAGADALLHTKVNDLTRAVLAVVECVTEMRSEMAAAGTGGGASASASAPAPVVVSTSNEADTKLLKEIQATLNAQNASAKANAQSISQLTSQATSQLTSQVTSQLTAEAVRKVVDAEIKKGVEAALRSKPWRDELAAQLQTDLTPALSQKVREAVKDTVRDTVKAALASSFRTAFESSLLPAFQAGTDRMFAQVQASFDQGMEGLAEQARRSQEYSDECAKCTIDLSREVAALRATVAGLESKVSLLSAASNGTGPAPAAALSDPVSLLEQGACLSLRWGGVMWGDVRCMMMCSDVR